MPQVGDREDVEVTLLPKKVYKGLLVVACKQDDEKKMMVVMGGLSKLKGIMD